MKTAWRIWCEHIQWGRWDDGFQWEFVWSPNEKTKLIIQQTPERSQYLTSPRFDWKFCPVCGKKAPESPTPPEVLKQLENEWGQEFTKTFKKYINTLVKAGC